MVETKSRNNYNNVVEMEDVVVEVTVMVEAAVGEDVVDEVTVEDEVCKDAAVEVAVVTVAVALEDPLGEDAA